MLSFASILPTFESAHMWGYLIIFLISFLESIAFVGIFVPGTVVIAIAGFAAAQGYLDVAVVIWFAAIGAILGDALSFSLGKKGTRLFRQENKILRAAHLERGEKFLKKYGSKSVFLGRFIGPIRPIIPFVAGMFTMNPREFYIWNIASAFGWSALYVLLGYFFGQAWQTVVVWSTRIGIFIVCVLLFFGLLYLLKQFVIHHGKRAITMFVSLYQSMRDAVATNPEVQKFAKRHTDSIHFMQARLTRKKFSGLPATLLAISFLYTFIVLLGLVEDFLSSDPIIAVDTRFANLLVAFRDPTLTKIFLWITAIGNSSIVFLLAASFTIAFWIWKKRYLIFPLWLGIIGSQAVTFIGKVSLHRARPSALIPVYAEDSYSFPSGHAAAAVLLYGFIIYCIWRNTSRWAYRINALFVGIGIIVCVGFSRLYLGVHFLSDVLSGYLVGLLWLIISISITEWQHSRRDERNIPLSSRAKAAGYGVIAIAYIFSIGYAFVYNPPKQQGSSAQLPLPYVDIPHIPKFTETLAGNPQEPLGFIITAPSDEVFVAAFQRAGWQLADPISFRSISTIATAAILGRPYNTAPITPSFWNAQIHTFGFEKSTDTNNVAQRHHARFWKTDFRDTRNMNIYVGTASLDTNIKWFVTHRIGPDIDTEKTILIRDLQQAQAIRSVYQQPFVDPILGKNFSGDQFFTDGQVYIGELQ